MRFCETNRSLSGGRVRRLASLMLLTALLGSACASAELSTQTRSTWQPRCTGEITPVALPALALILAPKIIDATVDHVGSALKAAAGSEAVQFKASTQVLPFYDIIVSGEMKKASGIGCLVLVRGTFDRVPGDDVFAGLKDTHFRFEAKIQPIKGTKYFQLVPYYLSTSKLEPGNFWSRTGDYTVSVNLKALGTEKPFGSATFTFTKIEEGTELKTPDVMLTAAASDPIAYPGDLSDAVSARDKQAKKIAPELAALAILDALEQATKPNPRQPRPQEINDPSVKPALHAYCIEKKAVNASLPEAQREFDSRCNEALNKAATKLDEDLAKAFYSPASVTWAKKILCTTGGNCKKDVGTDVVESSGKILSETVLTETRLASKFGLQLAEILTASSEEIKKALKDQLPDAKKKAQDLEAVTGRANRQAVILADLEVEKAEADLMAVSQTDQSKVLAAQLELTKKRIAANEAYRKTGLLIPYPEFE